jgi:hypothetical protein
MPDYEYKIISEGPVKENVGGVLFNGWEAKIETKYGELGVAFPGVIERPKNADAVIKESVTKAIDQKIKNEEFNKKRREKLAQKKTNDKNNMDNGTQESE